MATRRLTCAASDDERETVWRKRAAGEGALATLPGDHMLEARALGCRIRPLAGGVGFEALPSCSSLDEVLGLGPIDLQGEEVSACLQKCGSPAARGQAVLFMLTGPLTLASSLLGVEALLKAIRRDMAGACAALRHLGRESARLAGAAAQAGADLVGVSDPLCGKEYFGPRALRQLGQEALLCCIRDLLGAIGGQAQLALCPRLCSALSHADGVRVRSVQVGAGQARWQAMLGGGGHATALGGVCLEAEPLRSKGGHLLAFDLQ